MKVDQQKNRRVYNTAKHKVEHRGIVFLVPPIELNFLFILVSKPAPFFEGISVVNGEFKEIRLTDFKDKYLVLLFYPLDL